MTQTLDVNERVSQLGRTDTTVAATSTEASKFGTFAITFGIAFAILYTVFERLNWPLFTYHPAVGKLDFWMQPARSGEGPPMYWYGWLALSAIAATAVAWAATIISVQQLQRATIFACALTVLWSVLYWIGISIADQASVNAEFLKSVWPAAIPALAGAAAVGYFVPLQTMQRMWTGWLLVMPIGGLVILGYSLKQYFLR